MTHAAAGFLGTWELDPASCVYEGGPPPRSGTYVLSPIEGGIAFTVDWVDPEGNARHVTFETVFGEKDGLAMEMPDATTLITRAPAGVITLATRRLVDGRMVIVQEGMRADGTPFANTATYDRR